MQSLSRGIAMIRALENLITVSLFYK
jgi:hypothetical protein